MVAEKLAQEDRTGANQVPRLSLHDVRFAFGKLAAVDGITLTIAQGEFVSLLGPSGCGKTTILRMIAGFLEPTAGSIELDGTEISAPGSVVPPERRRMSMIFQSYAVWPNMTVFQNVAFGLRIRRVDRNVIQKKVTQMLGMVQLSAFADRYPSELSGGQQQRVALARAMVIEPQILLMDEPLSNLDANLREEMRFEIRRLHDEFGYTTIYVTHDQSEAMVTSDRIAVMNAGRIEQVDTPSAVYARPRTKFVAGFLGRTNLIKGARDGDWIQFDGFSIPVRAIKGVTSIVTGLLFSVRPQSMRLYRSDSSDQEGGGISFRGRIARRAYLGDAWDYTAVPENSDLELRITARPQDTFDIGASVWIELDAAEMVPIQD